MKIILYPIILLLIFTGCSAKNGKTYEHCIEYANSLLGDTINRGASAGNETGFCGFHFWHNQYIDKEIYSVYCVRYNWENGTINKTEVLSFSTIDDYPKLRTHIPCEDINDFELLDTFTLH